MGLVARGRDRRRIDGVARRALGDPAIAERAADGSLERCGVGACGGQGVMPELFLDRIFPCSTDRRAHMTCLILIRSNDGQRTGVPEIKKPLNQRLFHA